MRNQSILLLLSFVFIGLSSLAQPYVVNEKVTKVFSEGFTDINDHFEITPSSDSKFWGTYGDGYYYMERKIASPRAIVVNADAVSKNFYIKSKVLLGPSGNTQSSIGILFLAQAGGKGGFVFEINKKKSFRIKDLGTGAFITKEGTNGWLKSKIIAPATRNNTIEIKGFRGKFDIYINGSYLYSFVNSSYEKGKFGAYIGANTDGKIYYYNVYKLNIPGAKPEVNLTNLNDQIEALKLENDSLKTIALAAKFGGNDKAAIIAIKVLEEQLKAVNEDNLHLKKILKDYEDSDPKPDSVKAADDQSFTVGMVERISNLSEERDSVVKSINQIRNNFFKVSFQRDSLRKVNLNLERKMNFLEKHMREIQEEIDALNNEIIPDSIKNLPKKPSTPSQVAAPPIMPKLNTSPPAIKSIKDSILEAIVAPDTIEKSIMIKKDSIYSHTIDIDKEIGVSNGGGLFENEAVVVSDSTNTTQPKDSIIVVQPSDSINITQPLDSIKIETPKKIEIVPLKDQKIKVQKAIKAEFKD